MSYTPSSLTDSSHTFQALGLSRHCPLETCEAKVYRAHRGTCCGAGVAFSSTEALRFPPNPHSPLPHPSRKKLFPKGLSLKKKAITCHFA